MSRFNWEAIHAVREIAERYGDQALSRSEKVVDLLRRKIAEGDTRAAEMLRLIGGAP